MILPNKNGTWHIVDYNVDMSTLKESYNYIDLKLGGMSGLGRYAGKQIPRRWTDEMCDKLLR